MELQLIDTLMKYNVAENDIISQPQPENRYRWSASKTSLVELLRGVLSTSAINNGDVVMDEFILYMGNLLGSDLKGHRSLYHDISERMDDPKIGNTRTKYLNKMVASLSRELLELEERQHR